MPVTVAQWQDRNPLAQAPGFFRRAAARPIYMRRQDVEPAGVLAPGTLRRYVRGLVNVSAGNPSFSWSRNDFDSTRGRVRGAVTAPENYLISTRHVLTVGNQLRGAHSRPFVAPWVNQPIPPLVHVGNAPGRPSVRERILSFGSRVIPLNGYGPDAEAPS